MQPSKLVDNINSNYIEALNAILPKTDPFRIYVYVESEEDIAFGRNLLAEYESEVITFDIQTPSNKVKAKAIEKSQEILSFEVGKYLIVCVDSDYDYILPDLTNQAKLLNENPHIFQTYSYSIENLQCYEDSLHAVCVQSTKFDKRIVNFSTFLREYSKIIYSLFLWNVHFRKVDDHTTFTIADFCSEIKLTDKVDVADNFTTALEGLKNRVESKVSFFELNYSQVKEEINVLKVSLEALGLTEENVYLFTQGHTIKDNVVMMILKSVYSALVKEKESQIKIQYAENHPQMLNEMGYYKNQKQNILVVLNSNTEFKKCFLYKKIKKDLDNYISTFN